MPVEVAMWKLGEKVDPVEFEAMPSESQLEDILVKDIGIVDPNLLLIGRQVATAHGNYIDLLGMAADGNLVVIELKRDRTPREVIAQVLDCHTGGAAAHPLGQWARIHGQSGQGVALSSGRQDALHRAGKPLGELLRGISDRQAQRRVARKGDLRYAGGGEGTGGAVAVPLQPCQAAQCAGV